MTSLDHFMFQRIIVYLDLNREEEKVRNHHETISNQESLHLSKKDTDGTPLDLINVLTYVQAPSSGVSPEESRVGDLTLDRVDTFIGRNDRGEFVKVGGTENLSVPGAIFRYASYVREQEGLLGFYLQCYHKNLCGSVCTKNSAYYRVPISD